MSKREYVPKVAELEKDPRARAKLRGQLRAERGAVLADAEGFEVLVHAIESVGKWVVPSGSNLDKYTPGLVHLTKTALGWHKGDKRIKSLEASLFLLRQTRNDYAHEGVHARNAAHEAVEVALLLEEALSFSWVEVRLEDVMVRRPVTADAEDTLAEIRRVMLSNSFSFIPVRIDGSWHLVAERWMADQVVGKKKSDRDAELGRKVNEFKADLPEVRPRKPETRCAKLEVPLPDLILVAERSNARVLMGVVSPSDLL